MVKLSILSQQEQDSIHSAALNILKTVGCEIQDNKWLNLLSKNGLKVDFTTSRVFITNEDIVNSSLESCGHSIKYAARDPQKDWIIGQGMAKTHTPEGMTHIIDLKSRSHREAQLSDLIDLTKICDYLPNVDGVVDPVVPYDVPPALQGVVITKTLIENTTKPIDPAGIALKKGFPFVIQMLVALLGDRDISEYSLGIGVTATSPLQFPFDQLDAYWKGIELGSSCDVGSMPQAGSTAPASLAGTLTLFVAEILMGLILGQVKKPGLSQFVFVRPCLSNPRYGIFNSGSPEVGLLQAAATQICKEKYGLFVNAGWGVSDSHCINPQVAYEKCYIWMMSLAAGADMISGIGGLGSGLISSPTQVVIDDEIIAHLRRGVQGILVDDFHLGAEMIEEIGIGKTFLFHPKTSQIMREEWYISRLVSRDSYSTWTASGAADLVTRAEKTAKEILVNHKVEKLESDLEEKLKKIFKEAKRTLL
ncbi:MAG: trimethylamine methyltransferase family protein [Candidatus Hodarchaeota archaeon]